MSAWITAATARLATYLVHSTLLLLGALAAGRLLRDPAARERLWKIALTAPLLTVGLVQLLPGDVRPVLDLAPRGSVLGTFGAPPAHPENPGTATTVVIGAPGQVSPAPSAAPAPAPVGSRDEPPRGRPAGTLGLAVVVLWLGGAVLLLTRRMLAVRRLRERLAARTAVRSGRLHDLLGRLCRDREPALRPRLSLADKLSTPLVVSRHEICLPRRVAEELSDRELVAILAHEVAHLRRGDLFWLRLCAGFECVLFVQPLNRLARRRLFEAAEMLCDDWAGERTGARLELAQGLATVARWSRVAPAPLPLPCLGGDRGALVQRVERLLAEPERRRRTIAASLLLAAAAVALAFVGPAVQLDHAAAPDLGTLDLDALVTLRKQACAIATERLLALPEGWEQQYAELLAVPGTRIARVLQRGLHHDLSPKDQGGAYYSFAIDDHDYQREPDLGYEQDQLRTGFAGDNTGHIVDLGVVPLGSVTADVDIPGLDPEKARLCAFLATYARSGSGRADDAFWDAIGIERPDIGWAPAVAGHSYLLRAILPGEHDQLIAFTLVEVRHESIVLVGRVLKEWPLAEPNRGPRPRVDWSSEGAPAWLTLLEDADLFALQAQLATTIESRVFDVSTSAIKAATGLGPPEEAGLTRLLLPGQYDAVINVRGAGSYYSFATRSHSYDEEPDISWQPDTFHTAFYGNCAGAFLDVGDVPLADLELGSRMLQLTSRKGVIWPGLSEDELSPAIRGTERVPVLFGHTYLLRSTLPGEHDVLVAFRPVLEEADGLTIAWRMLKRFPMPAR